MSTQVISERDNLNNAFSRAKAENRPAFVAFLTAGYPYAESTLPLIETLAANGADVIELGIPFSDSSMDGPTIVAANNVAIGNGVKSMAQCVEYVKQARAKGITTPIVLMSAYNPIAQFSTDDDVTIRHCAEAGVSGFIIPDLPVNEASSFITACRKHNVSYVPLLAPTSSEARIFQVAQAADTFVYAVAVLGVTGARSGAGSTDHALPKLLATIKSATSANIAVGFGIATNDQFCSLADSGMQLDGVVIGSAIISTVTAATKGEDKAADITAQCGALANYCTQVTKGAVLRKSEPVPPIVDAAAAADALDGLLPSHMGVFGGMYVPETLMGALIELDKEFQTCLNDPAFLEEFRSYYDYMSRPSSLHKATRLSEQLGGATIWLKREDLNHTGSHKVTNALGQALMAKRLGKKRVIAETGAGQHGVATATVCALLGLECVVYMGAEDVKRQELNVFRMKLLGAQVVCVEAGSKTLKDAINEAMKEWVASIRTTHYLVGSAIGPHPFPTIVKWFQQVISVETKQQFAQLMGGLPDAIVACVGGGSNAIGSFAAFVDEPSVRLIGVEAAGSGLSGLYHSATLTKGSIGVLHGCKTYLLQDEDGQVKETHSISAGLDYPGVGPEHANLKYTGRAEYVAVDDKEALEGCVLLSRTEGVIPALETSHAVYHAAQLAKTLPKDQHVVVTISGRGDKDVHTIMEKLPQMIPGLI